ncbi:hypothetical protein ZHAS_00003939 [Anopheles sinensis]|uniref:Uncharacterized protein n=1 Tax=Anopheles sinensis TaxID=74873 RepID=A0A084VFK0_ANOSI|nr:hypothetical protein ZHAS_00003939 [Anopheles sinensis]
MEEFCKNAALFTFASFQLGTRIEWHKRGTDERWRIRRGCWGIVSRRWAKWPSGLAGSPKISRTFPPVAVESLAKQRERLWPPLHWFMEKIHPSSSSSSSSFSLTPPTPPLNDAEAASGLPLEKMPRKKIILCERRREMGAWLRKSLEERLVNERVS